jgi:hypothetical protein
MDLTRKLFITFYSTIYVIAIFLVTAEDGICELVFGVDSVSIAGMQLELYTDHKIGTASGFFVKRSSKYYLITNWHVVTGRHPMNDSLLVKDPPKSIGMWIMLKQQPGQQFTKWYRYEEPLFGQNSKKKWIEHPTGRSVDVVALPLDKVDSSWQLVTVEIDEGKSDVALRVAMPVSVVGYPHGITGSGRFPIWKTGYLASEPQVDFQGLPAILIDVRTIEGMSGSPAFMRSYGSYLGAGEHEGYRIGKTGTRFVGVYSGRMPVKIADKATQSDLGIIWKPVTIREILESDNK